MALVNNKNEEALFQTALKLSLCFCLRHQPVKFHLDFQIFLVNQKVRKKGGKENYHIWTGDIYQIICI